MKRKSKIKVLGQWIKIEHVDLTKEDLFGDACAITRKIRLETTLTDSEYKRLLAHEVEHIRLRLSGLVEMMTPELEEALAVLAESR